MDKILNQIKLEFLPNYLENIKNNVWKIPENVPVKLPNGEPLERHIALKSLLEKPLKESKGLDTHYWIIRDWGGIKGFNKGPENNKILRNLPKMLESGKLPLNVFDRISSFSKVASFLEPKQYAIYDSRVIFSLNWLLFKHCDDEQKLFPQPQGRNTQLAKYHLPTLFELSDKTIKFYEKEEAYHRYCGLMRDWSKKIFGQEAKPYEMEMLLFYIAPKLIIEDIKKCVNIRINLF